MKFAVLLVLVSFVCLSQAAIQMKPDGTIESGKAVLDIDKIGGLTPAIEICCKVDTMEKPIFDSFGRLKEYKKDPCPNEFVTCCPGFISIYQTCFFMDDVKTLYPIWQNYKQMKGFKTIEEAIKYAGHEHIFKGYFDPKHIF